MSDHGLDIKNLPTLRWLWIPEKPLPLNQALPKTWMRNDNLFSTSDMSKDEEAAYRFSFPQLSKQTPDLRFYRLLQILNVPLCTLDSRDMGRSDFAYWEGVRPKVDMRHTHLYFWFFRDQNDFDLIVAEYGFDGSFTLRSEKKSKDHLATFFEEICNFVNKPKNRSPNRKAIDV